MPIETKPHFLFRPLTSHLPCCNNDFFISHHDNSPSRGLHYSSKTTSAPVKQIDGTHTTSGIKAAGLANLRLPQPTLTADTSHHHRNQHGRLGHLRRRPAHLRGYVPTILTRLETSQAADTCHVLRRAGVAQGSLRRDPGFRSVRNRRCNQNHFISFQLSCIVKRFHRTQRPFHSHFNLSTQLSVLVGS